jgi:hypothetical protein
MKFPTSRRHTAHLALAASIVALAACAEDQAPDLVIGSGIPKAGSFAMQRFGGQGQIGTVRQALGDSLSVRVITTTGTPVSGISVRWATSSPGATMSPVSNNTAPNGIARSRWTLGQLAGPQFASATVDQISSPVNFEATARPGTASFLRVVEGNLQSGVINQAATSALRLQVTDDFDNPVSGVTVDWIYAAAGDSGVITVTGPGSTPVPNTTGTTLTVTTVSDANGDTQATWRYGSVVGIQAVRADAPGAAVVRFTSTVAATAPGASKLRLVQDYFQEAPRLR